MSTLLARPEREIQAAILAYLDTCPGVVAWRSNVGAVTARNREGKTRHVRFGVRGLPDIIGWRCERVFIERGVGGLTLTPRCYARFLAIEVKRPGARPTPAQAAFLTLVQDAGGVALVATSVQDVARGLGR